MAKTYSATVKVIKDGRVTIPGQIREVEGIVEGDFIKITIEKIERRGTYRHFNQSSKIGPSNG
jgi:bifunctional DNA-binding transcriptional regulator/antitoxin component of YhaV-PrlF toxin-antitoxin module